MLAEINIGIPYPQQGSIKMGFLYVSPAFFIASKIISFF
tara:strand:+ start:949 stop:1065 length:117 start_codon:yes stop_codon:yes gene_type:complete